jgi:fatty-acyl-CoA synthase
VRSTMQDVPLTVTRIMQYGTTMCGDAEVVTWQGESGRRASYSSMGERVARLANGLRQLGIDGDDRVGTFMWNNQEHLEAYLAIPSMGAVLHTLNIRLFPEQVVYIANHAEDRVVIVDASLVPVFAKLLPQLESIRAVVVAGEHDANAFEGAKVEVVSYDELLAANAPSYDWPNIDELDAAAMCYTSGTTGNPKGVAYSHRSMYLHSMAVCMGDAMALSGHDRVLPVVPMFHANAWGLPYAALMVGASLVMPDRYLQAEPLAKLITTEKPTFAGAVPTVWNDLLQYAEKNPVDASSLRLVACGGSAVPRKLMERFESELGVTVMQAWGMTETSPCGSIARPPAGVDEVTAWDYRSTAGKLLCGIEGRLVGDDGEVMPYDGKAVGEVEVRGPWVTAAYYKPDDDAADEKFHDGWLRTGDVGTIDPAGYLVLTDRAKDVIKSGGEWISSVDLENTIMSHPDVVEAAVVGVPDEKWQERPLAVVVLRDGAHVDAAAMRGWLAEHVAQWQLPERWTFVEAVPRTSVGKFDKKVVRQQYAEGSLEVATVGNL